MTLNRYLYTSTWYKTCASADYRKRTKTSDCPSRNMQTHNLVPPYAKRCSIVGETMSQPRTQGLISAHRHAPGSYLRSPPRPWLTISQTLLGHLTRKAFIILFYLDLNNLFSHLAKYIYNRFHGRDANIEKICLTYAVTHLQIIIIHSNK